MKTKEDRLAYWRDYSKAQTRNGKRIQRSRRERGLPAPTRAKPETCECCGRLPASKPLMLDHCHVSGVFRGWLCVNCNLGIGMLGDSANALRQALNYIERSVK
jgi:hypothetical protein